MEGKFWYSQRQKEIANCQNFCQLDNGNIVEYTEMVTQGKNRSSTFDDATYLGTGVYHSSERIGNQSEIHDHERYSIMRWAWVDGINLINL